MYFRHYSIEIVWTKYLLRRRKNNMIIDVCKGQRIKYIKFAQMIKKTNMMYDVSKQFFLSIVNEFPEFHSRNFHHWLQDHSVISYSHLYETIKVLKIQLNKISKPFNKELPALVTSLVASRLLQFISTFSMLMVRLCTTVP